MPVYIPIPLPIQMAEMKKKSVIMEEQVREILKRADANKDGCLTKDDLKKALKEIGSRWPSYRARRLLQVADSDHDGQICGKLEMDKLVAAILNWYADKY